MIDFNKKILNSKKFTRAADHFREHGCYTFAPFGTKDFRDYWDEEMRRSLDGYTAEDGDFVTGFNYFYLNYCQIDRTVLREVTLRDGTKMVKKFLEFDFPNFYDYDYYYFQYIQECQDYDKDACVLKARRKGFSYKASAMLLRNYFLISGSKGFVYASDKRYLDGGDGMLNKCWQMMDFIDANTAWTKDRDKKDNSLHRRASTVIKKAGKTYEVGSMAEIIGTSLNKNPDKVRGRKGLLAFYEESGTFPELEDAWGVSKASYEQDGYKFGLQCCFGTGSIDNKDFQSLKKFFYNTESQNILGVPNIWDKSASESLCGFFVPHWANMDNSDEHGNRLFMDNDGNTLREKAEAYVLEQREKILAHAVSSTDIDRELIERPVCPQEACLILGGNIFPKRECQEQLSYIRTNRAIRESKHVGELVRTNEGSLKWVETGVGDITKYELRDTEPHSGSIVIWEHPSKEAGPGLYIGALDPVDWDSGTSLASTMIFKRVQSFESFSDILVAEYTGRPEKIDDYYENVLNLAEYYGCKIMYENNLKGFYTYAHNNRRLHLLAKQPKIIKDIMPSSTVDRGYGCHMSKQMKEAGLNWAREYLLEPHDGNLRKLHTIKSEPLLEEFISYNNTGNFDRVMAFVMLMIYRQELYTQSVKRRDEIERSQMLFSKPLFSREWFESEETKAGIIKFTT